MILAVFFAYLSDRKVDLMTRKICWTISFFCLFLPVAFRGYGVDHQSYIEWYKHIKSFGTGYFAHYNFMPEPLYALLNYIIANTVDNVQYVFILSAFIPLSLIYLAFSKYRGRINLAICLWTFCFCYYLFMFGLVRISIALGIITYAYNFMENRNFKKYMFFCLIAFLFHYSAIIMLPIYFLVNHKTLRLTKIENNFSILKYSVAYIISTTLLFYLVHKYFPFIFGSFSWFGRYRYYFQSQLNWEIIKSQAFVIPILVMLFLGKKYFLHNIFRMVLYIKLLLIMLSFSIGSIFFPIHRVCFYFIPACCYCYASVPRLRFSTNNTEQGIITAAYSIIMLVIGIVWIYLIVFNSDHWKPFLIPYFLNFPN